MDEKRRDHVLLHWPRRVDRGFGGYPFLAMRIALPTLIATLAAVAIGTVVANLGWSFLWVVLTMVGVVVVLGTAALIVAMVWPESRRQPAGHTVGV